MARRSSRSAGASAPNPAAAPAAPVVAAPVVAAAAKAAKPLVPCGCGCGVLVRREFAQGHDAKLKSALLTAASAGDEAAKAKLAARDWLPFLVVREAADQRRRAALVARQRKLTEQLAKLGAA